MRDIKKFLKPKEIFNLFKKIPRQVLIGAGLIMMAGLLIFFGINSIMNPPVGYKEFQNGVLSLKNNEPVDTAVKYFREVALKGTDQKLTSAALYNLGTIYFYGALAGGEGSMDLLKNAISCFQMTLRQDPTNRDAKYNLELALRYLASAEPQESEEMNPGRQGSQDEEEPEW